MLLEEKTAISWQNISAYLACKESDTAIVTDLLGRQHIVDSLSSQKISTANLTEENRKSLSKFILNNDEIDDADYCELIKSLTYFYHAFPAEVSEVKIACLAKERVVRLAEESFAYAVGNDELKSILISKNFDEYKKNRDQYQIDDDVRKLLLSSEITDKNKVSICLDVTPQGASANKQLSQLIANVLVANNVDCSTIDIGVLSSAIIKAQNPSDSIKLLMKCIPHWDEEITMRVLAELPPPYNEISLYGKHPRLKRNELNLEFAKILETRNFISSIKEGDREIKINTFKSSGHS